MFGHHHSSSKAFGHASDVWLASKHLHRLHSLVRHVFPKIAHPQQPSRNTKTHHNSSSQNTLKRSNRLSRWFFRQHSPLTKIENVEHLKRLLMDKGEMLSMQDLKSFTIGQQPYYVDEDGDIANEFYEVVHDAHGNEVLVQIVP